RLKTGGAAYFLVSGTLREGLFAAVIAISARNVVEDHNSVASREILHSNACFDDYSGGFMAKNARRRVRTCVDFLQICAANTTGMNANQNLAGANLRNGHSLDTHIVYAAIDGSLHGRGYVFARGGRLIAGYGRHDCY